MTLTRDDLILNASAQLIAAAAPGTALVAVEVPLEPGASDCGADLMLVDELGEVVAVLTFVLGYWEDECVTFRLDRALRNHLMLLVEAAGIGEHRPASRFVLPVVDDVRLLADPDPALIGPVGIRLVEPSSIEFTEALTATLTYRPSTHTWLGLTREPNVPIPRLQF